MNIIIISTLSTKDDQFMNLKKKDLFQPLFFIFVQVSSFTYFFVLSLFFPTQDHVTNHDICDSCGEGGELLCCDKCPSSFHLECLNPPLLSVPEGDWFCNPCRLAAASGKQQQTVSYPHDVSHHGAPSTFTCVCTYVSNTSCYYVIRHNPFFMLGFFFIVY